MKSTEKGYLMGYKDFANFCILHHLPIDPTPLTLARYILYTSIFIASSPKYLTGACHFLHHQFPQFDDNCRHPLVATAIAGARKTRADPVGRKLPLQTTHLEQFLQIANNSGAYDDLLFATILSCCFYACHRSGELVWKNDRSLQDWRKVIKRSSLTFTPDRASYHLPYHKADRFYRGTTILFTKHMSADPVSLLHRYATQRDQRFGAQPALFMREDASIPTRS